MDQAFLDWLAFIPNPEKSQYEELESQIIEDPNIGATAEGRTRALAKARRFAGILDLVFTVFLLWGLLSLRHRSAFIVMFAVLPWGFVVIASRSRGLFTIRTDLPFSDPHPSLAKQTVGPGLCLLLLSLGQHLLHWTDAIPIAAVTAIALWGAAVTVEPAYRNKLRSSMSFLFLVLPYGFGAVVNLNTVLDHSPAREFQTQVVSKPAQSGNNPRMLYLASWGPVGETREVPVGGSLYRSVEQGDTVCVDLRRGAFGITWYDVHACDKIE
jgi:hypothetical protein